MSGLLTSDLVNGGRRVIRLPIKPKIFQHGNLAQLLPLQLTARRRPRKIPFVALSRQLELPKFYCRTLTALHLLLRSVNFDVQFLLAFGARRETSPARDAKRRCFVSLHAGTRVED